MENVCMHCRRLRTPRGRWVVVPEEHIQGLRDGGQLAYGACFACTRTLFGMNPDRLVEMRAER
jgi:hypothetical protein